MCRNNLYLYNIIIYMKHFYILAVLLLIFSITVNAQQDDSVAIKFADVEVKPVFPGGDVALMKFISDNCLYPGKAKYNRIEGRVFVQFTIGADGVVRDVIVAKGADKSLDKEAVRVVSLLPAWTPGMHNGEKVPVIFVVPINFRLTDDD